MADEKLCCERSTRPAKFFRSPEISAYVLFYLRLKKIEPPSSVPVSVLNSGFLSGKPGSQESNARHLVRRSLGIGGSPFVISLLADVTGRKKVPPKPFLHLPCVGWFRKSAASLQLMRSRPLFCAVLAILCAQLHAQSTGIFVNSSNNVGIGTTSPVAKLHVVAGNNQAIATYIPSSASGISDFATGGVGLQFSRPTDGAFAHGLYTYESAGNAKDNLAISSRDDIVFTAGSSGPSGAPERMRIADTGNVGIGTANPLRQFMLYSSYPVIGFQTSGDGLGWGIYSDGSDDSLKFIRYSNAAWTSYNNNIFTILANGNVGIGTTSPNYPLDVNGGIHSTVAGGSNLFLSKASGSSIAFDNGSGSTMALIEANNGPGLEFWTNTGANTGIVERMIIDNSGKVIITGQVYASSFVASSGNNYADFVFKPGYKLEPLSDVEASIRKDGHLPGIPSEAEAKANGIDLASMQVKLLQKIEELTLHQIEQEKRLNEQSKDIEQLRKENTELLERLAK